ncbi:MAG: hypothetical protein A4E63_02722 [Syntrophorhabdus sp. PtaU1.Bin050]|nr:MAG: hypothetical protein A4E63_02722 [Syntrophorhabdus sp. PtaU1.Bin050]
MADQHPYHFFLNGFDPDSETTGELTRLALADVQRSGLSPETLERAQVKLFKGGTELLKKRLRFAHVDGNPLLRAHRLIEFPHLDGKGNVTRYEYKPFPSLHFKNEKEPRRYLQGKGDEPTPYIVPDVWAAKDKGNKPLWITEGVKKTLKLVQHGRLSVGLSGVWNFRSGKDRHDQDNKQLWRELEGFRWTGRTVYIGFDSDLWTNPQVRFALYELAFTLYQRGALLRFPVWHGAKGIDDFLVLRDDPDQALTELESTAKDLEGLLCTDHRNEIMGALYRSTGTQGVNERTLIDKVAKGLGQKAKDIKNDIARQRHNELKQAVDLTLYPYFINDTGGVCRWRRERDGTEVPFELSNFTARIVEDVSLDSGLEVTRRFTIEGGTKDKTFTRASVRTTEFLNLNWVVNNWGNDAIIRAGQSTKDYLREFIQIHSNHNSVKRRTVYGHTGWRQVDGTWCYLMANGAIGADGVDVELPHEFMETGRYCLPKNAENEKEVLDAIFSFLDIGKAEIFFPALSYVFLSPLTGLLDPMPSFSFYLYGERDSLKTSVAVLMLAFFGKHSRAGLSNFDSTANAIMHRSAILKDTLFLVDDLYPSSQQKEAQRKETVAQLLIRACGNRTGRGRLNPDSTEKISPIPRGMVIITGEEIPGLQSTLSRLITIEFAQGDINTKKLTEVQKQAGLFPHAMSSYILWLRDRIASIQADFETELYESRKGSVVESTSRKIPEHLIYLHFAWKMFLQWAVERCGLKEALRDEFFAIGREIFTRVAERHTRRIEGEDPVKMFFEIVGALLTQGKLRLDHRDSGYAGRLGGDSGELVGWYDKEHYYLLPVPLWHAVQTYLRYEGGHFPFSKTTLYETLERRGILETRGGKREYTQRFGDRTIRVLTLKRGKDDPLQDTEGEM